MPLEEPRWWYGAPPDDRRARLLAPLGHLRLGVERRFRRAKAVRFPVVCVGNFTAGGTGKTPLAILIAEELARAGAAPVFLTRGYGGRPPGRSSSIPRATACARSATSRCCSRAWRRRSSRAIAGPGSR